MGICLIKELRGSVQNDELLKVGELAINVSMTDSPIPIYRIAGTANNVAKIKNGLFYSDSAGEQSLGDTVSLTTSARTIYCKATAADCRIIISDFYNMTNFYSGENTVNNFAGVSFSQLSYIASPSWLSFNASGNFNDLNNVGTLVILLIGDDSYGDLKPFVNKLSNVKGNNKSIRFGFTGNVTLNGTQLRQTKEGDLLWQSSSKFYIKSLSSQHYAYSYGYSDEEIETMTATGGVLDGFTVTKCD